MPRDPVQLVGRAGRGDPDRDQHFLVDDRVLDRLPEYLRTPADHILEIGPGTGALTDRLLATGARVTAIERDPELVAFLREEFAGAVADGTLRIVEDDALEVTLPDFDACVSNLPYGVASQLLFRLLPANSPMVLTFQQEFVDRLVAEPGTSEYGRLSVTARHYASIAVAETIPPTAFDPAPPVESAVAVFQPRSPTYDLHDDAVFMDVVRALFTQRRKTVRNAIRNTTHISGIEDSPAVLEALENDLLDRRPDAVRPEEYAHIANVAVEVGELSP